MNPIVRLLVDALLREIQTHPEVIDQLVHESVAAFVAYLKSLPK